MSALSSSKNKAKNSSSNKSSPKLQPAQKVGGVRVKSKKAHISPKHVPNPQPIDKTFQTLQKVELPPSPEQHGHIPKSSQYPANKNPPSKYIPNNKKQTTHNIQQPRQGF